MRTFLCFLVATSLCSVAPLKGRAEVIWHVSVKLILGPNGERPGSPQITDPEIQAQFDFANSNPSFTGRGTRLEKSEVIEVTPPTDASKDWFAIELNDANHKWDLEAEAVGDAAYAWSTEKINIYLNDGTSGGSSSFRSSGHSIIVPGADKMQFSLWTFIQEIGHFMSLPPTFDDQKGDCSDPTPGDDGISDTIPDHQCFDQDGLSQAQFAKQYSAPSASQKAEVENTFSTSAWAQTTGTNDPMGFTGGGGISSGGGYTLTSPPYTLAVSNLPIGSHLLTARAVDSLGLSADSAPVAETIVAPGAGLLVGYWTFDDPSNPGHDSSGYANHGAASNVVPAPGVEDCMNSAASFFDASNSVLTIPDRPSLAITGAVSIAGWVKHGAHDTDVIINKGGDLGQPLNYNLSILTQGAPERRLFFASTDSPWYTPVAADNEWHHYAVVAINGVMPPQFFVDGDPRPATSAYSTPRVAHLIPNTDPATIGSGNNFAPGPGDPTLDDVRLYDGALTPEDVRALYESTEPFELRQPVRDVVAFAGGSATFRVGVRAGTSQHVTYQWSHQGKNLTDGGNVSGSATPVLTIHPVTQADYGAYQVSIVHAQCTAHSAAELINPADCSGPPPGVVSHWNFDGQTLDQAGTNHGTLEGNAHLTKGISGCGMEVGCGCGNDKLRVPHAPELSIDSTQPVSFSFWFYQTQSPAGADLHFFGKRSPDCSGTPDNHNYQLHVIYDDAGPEQIGWGNTLGSVGGTYELTNRVWTHFAGTFDGTGASLYVNGTLIDTRSPIVLGDINPYDLLIGTSGACAGVYGVFDEFLFYRRALTPTEVGSLYARGGKRTCASIAPTVIGSSDPPPSVCGELVTLKAQIADVEGDALEVQWLVNGTPYQTDLVSGDGCSLTSNTVTFASTSLPAGANSVVAQVFDGRSGYAYWTNRIVVVDTTPPTILCPPDMIVPAPGPTAVDFSVRATDGCGAAPTVVCIPPPGSLFPLGTTVVHCTAVDASGNSVECNFQVTLRRTDFGDAPDSYHTLLSSGGASHPIASGVYLGFSNDAEADGSPDALASGDGADDDGVLFGAPLALGARVPVAVIASTTGWLDAWIDFDRNGSFADAGEQVFVNESLTAGSNGLYVDVPANAKEGPSYARFRFSTGGHLSFDGPAVDGEVEDYLVYLMPCNCASNAPVGTDPLLTSWMTQYSDLYGMVVTNDGGMPTNLWASMARPVFADVQQIDYSGDFVYMRASGLASYQMGPWYEHADRVVPFHNLPLDQNLTSRFPRHPQPSMTPSNTSLGEIGFYVNGSAIYNSQDHFAWSDKDDADVEALDGSGNWHRDAWFAERFTFDPGFFHQPENGQQHAHADPIALRYQLDDNVSMGTNSLGTIEYFEHTNGWHHSPIVGWAFDGHPVYGPYGYANPLDTNSGIRRMVSGYGLRDAMDPDVAGRKTLPAWAGLAQGRASNTLDSADWGPPIARVAEPLSDFGYELGRYIEDREFLGDLAPAAVKGKTWDLDRYNGRCTKTPEFPNGTYAYFLTLDSNGVPAFPYTIGPQYCGVPQGGVTNITGPVTNFFNNIHDWGDAPDSYHTSAFSNGPFHDVGQGWKLGGVIDSESDGQPSPGANGDDIAGLADEDGVTFLSALVPGVTATVRVAVSTPSNGFLNVWFDFNRDGDFADAGEHILDDLAVVTGTYDLPIAVPAGALHGSTYARFRLSNRPGITFDGNGGAGEVEDYAISICGPPQITCPSGVSVLASNHVGTVVQFAVTAADACDAAPVVVCRPPSGSQFPPGTTPVTCTASDAWNNTASCSFAVQVQEITASRTAGGLVLRWDVPSAILEEADQLIGPWRTVPGATSPLTVQTREPSKFYRLSYVDAPRLEE